MNTKVLSIWLTNDVVSGQIKTDLKSNEITAMPLLDLFELLL